MKMKSLNAGKLFLLFAILILIVQQVKADISGVYGVDGRRMGNKCADSSSWYVTTVSTEKFSLMSSCSITSNKYVPKSGQYHVEVIIRNIHDASLVLDVSSELFNVDATKTIAQQSIHAISTATDSYSGSASGTELCLYLVDTTNHKFTPNSGTGCNDGNTILPPTPPIPDTSCTLNDGNALNVNLGNVDRAQLPTVPGSGSMRHIQVPVDCTGGDVTVNMQLNYTPIVLSAGQVIKSSSNGLGVSVVYNSKILSSTDITPVTFTTGSNSMDFAFQAVRDPTVEIKDVPTGAFTASAVLVMTQQ